jgi:hypothetical protein
MAVLVGYTVCDMIIKREVIGGSCNVKLAHSALQRFKAASTLQ